MYSTCIFCHSALGTNEAIEHFPVGRRLAFDAAKGRLWAVCKSCERWNLSPIDERWEAIDECEKLFRDTKLRISTDNIGLARLKEGTTLVRVGDPQRPEMAAWRYGDQFHRRRTKHAAIVTVSVVAVAGLYIAPVWLGVAGIGSGLGTFVQGRWLNRTVATLPARGELLKLNRFMLAELRLHSNEAQGFALEVPHWPVLPRPPKSRRWLRLPKMHAVSNFPTVMLHGDDALSAARHLLPRLNRAGAKQHDVAAAVGVLENSRSPEQLFGLTAFASRGKTIGQLAPELRLALEMSLHEDDERRALEGELSILEDRWREAEEVAAISDDMFLPSGVNAMLKKLKGDRA